MQRHCSVVKTPCLIAILAAYAVGYLFWGQGLLNCWNSVQGSFFNRVFHLHAFLQSVLVVVEQTDIEYLYSCFPRDGLLFYSVFITLLMPYKSV